MSNVRVITDKMQDATIGGGGEKHQLGSVALTGKLPKGEQNETTVQVLTNMRKINLEKNKPIYKYAVKTILYLQRDSKTITCEASKSTEKGPEHERQKNVCSKAYLKACQQLPDLHNGGGFYYDRQASLYSWTKLKSDTVMVELKGSDISERSDFIKAEISITKVAGTFQSSTNDIAKTENLQPAMADKTIIEALNLIVSGEALKSKNVFTIGNSVHYLKDDSGIEYRRVNGQGGKHTAVGANKNIRALEGKNKTPEIYMTVAATTSLFHPNDKNLIDVLKKYPGFDKNLNAASNWAVHHKKALCGLYCYIDYGRYKDVKDERIIIRIRDFGNSARNQKFEKDNKEISVLQYFQNQYSRKLSYPDLFTIIAKGPKGKMQNIPVECLILCNNQKVTTDQMTGNEQADLIKSTAIRPSNRMKLTDDVTDSIGLGQDASGLVSIDENPESVKGRLLQKPEVSFGLKTSLNWNDPKKRGAPSDFNINRYYEPAKLSKWHVVFDQGAPLDAASLGSLMETMRMLGMTVMEPITVFIQGSHLRPIFEEAKQKEVQLLMFITREKYHYHQEMKSLEQEYDILTQDMKFETAVNLLRQPNTRKNISNKINMKLGGLNYKVGNQVLKNRLFIGLETSQKGGLGDAPLAVGFSANMMNEESKFSGGYIFVERSNDVYGPILQQVVFDIFTEAKRVGKKGPSEIVIFMSGVTEGQYALINERYKDLVKAACHQINANYNPVITIIAVSKIHNTRLFKDSKDGVENIEPGTVIDHTIVSPVLTEWYMCSAVARQGTVKAAKYTLICTTRTDKSVTQADYEKMTYALCYNHQIISAPVGLPTPLYLAGENSSRGAAILSFRGPIFTNGKLDLLATNKELGYSGKKLFATRFNA